MVNFAEKRRLLLHLYENGHKQPRKLQELTGMSRRWVFKCLKRIKDGSGLEHRRGNGRPRKLVGRNLQAASALSHHHPKASAHQIAQRLKRTRNINIAGNNVRKALKRAGISKKRPAKIPHMTPAQKNKRITFSRELLHHDFDNVFISDESTFQLDGNTIKVWCRAGKRPKISTSKFPKKVLVWGALSLRGALPLVFCTGNVNSEKYCEILESVKEEADELYPEGWVLQQDNARPHTSCYTKRWMQNNNITTLNWPPASPDLSPIENIWRLMKREVECQQPRDTEELKSAIIEAWDVVCDLHRIPLLRNIRSRFQKCIALRGECISRA